MSVTEQWAESAPSNGVGEEPAGAWTGRRGLAKLERLNALVLDSPPAEAIAAAKLLFAKKIGSEEDPGL